MNIAHNKLQEVKSETKEYAKISKECPGFKLCIWEDIMIKP
jgi:hypothetical protein